jgi:hypothetical protein
MAQNVPASMNHGGDIAGVLSDLINNTVSAVNQFADILIFKFRNNSTAAGKFGQSSRGLNDTKAESFGIGRRVFRNMADDIVQIGQRRVGPDDFTHALTFFSASSCETT